MRLTANPRPDTTPSVEWSVLDRDSLHGAGPAGPPTRDRPRPARDWWYFSGDLSPAGQSPVTTVTVAVMFQRIPSGTDEGVTIAR